MSDLMAEVGLVLRAQWTEPLTPETTCYYCGMAADTIDHVVPRWLLAAVRGQPERHAQLALRWRRMTVPACRECNDLAGPKFHSNLGERTAYVKSRLKRRYARVLRTPEWTHHELMELSPSLRARVVVAIEVQRLTRLRLSYPR